MQGGSSRTGATTTRGDQPSTSVHRRKQHLPHACTMAHSLMPASIVSRSRRPCMLAWARDKRCQTRPIEVAGWSARVVVGVMRLQPPCQQL